MDTVFGFTGRFFDDGTGLQWNLNRWYDPGVGRWLSEDPIGFGGGDPNLYRYVGNGPGMGVDPDGLEESTCWAVSKAFVGGLGQGVVNTGKGLGNMGKEIALGVVDMHVAQWEIAGNLAGANWRFDTYSNLGQASQQSDFSYVNHAGRTGAAVVTVGTSEQVITGYEWSQGMITDDEASERFGSTAVVQYVGGRIMAKRPGFWNKPIPKTPRIPGAGRLLGQKPPQAAPQAVSPCVADRVAAANAAIPDDALVNFGSVARPTVAPSTGPRSYWFRYGDIKHLTPKQLRAAIGELASAGKDGGAAVMRVSEQPRSHFTPRPGSEFFDIPEYTTDSPAPVSTNVPIGN